MTVSKTIPQFRLLKFARFLHPLARLFFRRDYPSLQRECMGLHFASPIGVAAGVDKRGEYTDVIACYSPSFIEIGPLRDVRLSIRNLKERSDDIVVLANVSNTPDLERSFSLLYDFVDGFVLNVSKGSNVSRAIDHLLDLRRCNDEYKPILFKIFPDLSGQELDEVADFALGNGIDGIMIAAEFLDFVRSATQGLLPVIAIAEIAAPERAAQMLDAGADLIALTNSPVHYGPSLFPKILKYLDKQ